MADPSHLRWLARYREQAAEHGSGPESFTCPRCGMTSRHPDDVREKYCGNCHDWTTVEDGG